MKTIILLILLLLCNVSQAYNDGLDRRILIVNESSSTITEIHASNVNRQFYGRNLMGNQVLYPGEEGVLNLDDNTGYCKFDFKIVTNGGTIYKQDLNICVLEVYTIYD